MSLDHAIFHITHVDNLVGIVREGGLWCDKQRIARGLTNTNIGYQHIKARRLDKPVKTSAGGTLGDHVPFNFCPRSVMLFVVYKGHEDFGGGQTEIVHLVSSVSAAVAIGGRWAFTDRHAALDHSLHYDDLAYITELPWPAIGARYWSEVREEKEAEFLFHEFFPWEGIAEVGVMTQATADKATRLIANAAHQPAVKIRPEWYY
jgi:hypothetical protein